MRGNPWNLLYVVASVEGAYHENFVAKPARILILTRVEMEAVDQ